MRLTASRIGETSAFILNQVDDRRWRVHVPEKADPFVVNGLDILFAHHFPEKQLPQHDQNQLVQFANNIRSEINQNSQLKSIYREFYQSRKQPRFELHDASKYAFNTIDPTFYHLFPTFYYLWRNPKFFQFVTHNILLQERHNDLIFMCRSQDEIRLIHRLTQSVLSQDSHYKDFINLSRRYLNELKTKSTTIQPKTLLNTQQDFIQALMLYSRPAHLTDGELSPYFDIASRVLKELNYPVFPDGATRLLTDLHIWRPWDNKENSFHREMSGYHLIQKETEFHKASGSPILFQKETNQYKKHDDCESFRHDFGSLAAFSVDDFTVSEVDDALSIEDDPNDPENPWIHVHVADPTVSLKRDSSLVDDAKERVITMYLPERHLPILPKSFTEPQASLTPGRVNYALTISMKLNDRGEVYKSMIRPSIIRNLSKLIYDDVDRFLKYSSFQTTRESEKQFINDSNRNGNQRIGRLAPWSVPSNLDVSFTRPSDSLASFFRRLDALAFKHAHRRHFIGNAITPTLSKPTVLLPTMFQDSPWSLPRTIPRNYFPTPTTDPEFHVRLDPVFQSPSRQMVAEFMIMAGSTSALFAHSTHTPIICRFQPQPSLDFLPTVKRILEKRCERTGKLLVNESVDVMAYLPRSRLTVDSKEKHVSLGVEGYAQMTSPLRRVCDLMSHWQVKSKLCELHGKQPNERLMKKEEVEKMLSGFEERERAMKNAMAKSTRWWVQEMFRRRLRSEPDILRNEIFSGKVLSIETDPRNSLNMQFIRIFADQLGVRVVVTSQSFKGQTGDWIWFRLSGVDVQTGNLLWALI